MSFSKVMTDRIEASGWMNKVGRLAPGLPALLDYRAAYLGHDLKAGLSVAAVALPVGVAYAQLAGFSPVSGIYASILPLLAYAIFGTARQVWGGQDSASCAMVAAALVPVAGGDAALCLSLSLALTLRMGLCCIGGSFLKLGALADFLSNPILVGFLNGVALSILLGQSGKIFGFSIEKDRILPRVFEFIDKIGQTHFPTLLVSAICLAVMLLAPKYLRRLPAALVAMIVSGLVTALFSLDALGVATVGKVASGLPVLHVPSIPLDLLPALIGDAAGLALVSFSSMMLTSRSFAEKNGYEIDADREFLALGMANIASSFSQGFAISGADSRTATSDANGGRTQLTGIVAAAALSLILLFFTEPLAYVPVAALGMVLVFSAYSLVNFETLKVIYKISRLEFTFSILATLGVVAVGAVQAIMLVVILSLLRFVQVISRPEVDQLGEVEGLPGLHSVKLHSGATTTAGLMLFRFNAPIVFFNAPHFRREVLAAVRKADADLKWLVLDMIPVTMIDSTGYFMIKNLAESLRERGIELVLAGRTAEIKRWAEERGFRTDEDSHRVRRFPTLRQALRAYRLWVAARDSQPLPPA